MSVFVYIIALIMMAVTIALYTTIIVDTIQYLHTARRMASHYKLRWVSVLCIFLSAALVIFQSITRDLPQNPLSDDMMLIIFDQVACILLGIALYKRINQMVYRVMNQTGYQGVFNAFFLQLTRK